MFDLLYEMIGGQHHELPRRRRFADPRLDDAGAVFVAPDEPQHTGWLGREEVPGARAVPLEAAAVDGDPQSVVEEIRALLAHPRRR
jgi:hypothetical protein